MKKLIFIFLLIILSITQSAIAQKDYNGNIKNEHSIKKCISKAINQPQSLPFLYSEPVYDIVRPLSEINSPDSADAFPWISPDGLRLYYNKHQKIYLAERKSITDSFSFIQPLKLNQKYSEYFSPWLTNNELNIFFVERNTYTIHHAKRNSRFEDFSNDTIVKLQGDIAGFISGMSFTQDLKQLFLFRAYPTYHIAIFKLINEDEYILINTLKIPSNYISGPGQLSKDDLSYYLSLEDTSKKCFIFFYKRNNVNESFDSLFYLNNKLVNDSNSRIFQPTLSENGNIIVFTRNYIDTWEGNDLYIAYNSSLSVNDLSKNKNNSGQTEVLSLYPNPTDFQICINLSNSTNKNVKVQIINSLGNIVFTKQELITDDKLIINTANFPSGLYFCTIKAGNYYESKNFMIIR